MDKLLGLSPIKSFFAILFIENTDNNHAKPYLLADRFIHGQIEGGGGRPLLPVIRCLRSFRMTYLVLAVQSPEHHADVSRP
jgi:hypothetical protein